MDVHPVVRYKDAAAAVDWLKRAFGLEEHVVYRDGDGVVQHAELRAGNGLIMLGRQSEAWMGGTSPDPLGSTVSLYVVVGADVVDPHHERAKAAGARIVMEPTDMDYGSRDYSARDPEGNLWSFGSYDPRAAVPE